MYDRSEEDMEEIPGNSDSSRYMGDKSWESNEYTTEDLRSIDCPQRKAGSTLVQDVTLLKNLMVENVNFEKNIKINCSIYFMKMFCSISTTDSRVRGH